MSWYLQALSQYAVFHGRAQRSEFWFFLLYWFIILIVLSVIDNLLGLSSDGIGIGLSGVFWLSHLVPYIAVSIRRLHDINKSGWWILINFIPLGAIVFLVFMALDSKDEDNDY